MQWLDANVALLEGLNIADSLPTLLVFCRHNVYKQVFAASSTLLIPVTLEEKSSHLEG